VQTTSLAALIAAAGVAIGVAWSGLPASFAAGIFLVILQPFKVGDFVVAGGVTGTVEEVGLFVTSVNTLDNIRNIIGNGGIFGDITRTSNQSVSACRSAGLAGPYRRCSRYHRRSQSQPGQDPYCADRSGA
jgi:small conductance mechanosensitive channel